MEIEPKRTPTFFVCLLELLVRSYCLLLHKTENVKVGTSLWRKMMSFEHDEFEMRGV